MAMTAIGTGRRRPPATPGLPRRPARLTEEVVLERLRLLAPLVAANRGTIPSDDRRRVGAVEFTWLLAEARRRGITARRALGGEGYAVVNTGSAASPECDDADRVTSITMYQGRRVQRPVATCKRGHEFTPENTYVFTDALGRSHRSCRRCRADLQARRRADQRVARSDRGWRSGSGSGFPSGRPPPARPADSK
jgi:hypothetical protein